MNKIMKDKKVIRPVELEFQKSEILFLSRCKKRKTNKQTNEQTKISISCHALSWSFRKGAIYDFLSRWLLGSGAEI